MTTAMKVLSFCASVLRIVCMCIALACLVGTNPRASDGFVLWAILFTLLRWEVGGRIS